MPYGSRSFKQKLRAKRRKMSSKKTRLRRQGATRFKQSATLGKGFPRMIKITHKYVENVSLTSNGAQTNYLWKCNGMNDPNYQVGGHQPLYFDQMSALYDHYTVIGSRCVIKVTPSAATTTPTHLMLRIDDDSTVPTGTENIMEQGGARFRIIPIGGSSIQTLTSRWSAKKTFGGSVLSNPDLQATSSTDPLELSYYQFGIRPMDGVTATTVYLQCYIEYIAIWKELKDIPSS